MRVAAVLARSVRPVVIERNIADGTRSSGGTTTATRLASPARLPSTACDGQTARRGPDTE